MNELFCQSCFALGASFLHPLVVNAGWFYWLRFCSRERYFSPSTRFVTVGLLPSLSPTPPVRSPVAAAVGQSRVWVGLRFSFNSTLTQPTADK